MKPVLIGVTGPAAGGKSLVMEALRGLGFFTIDSDSLAKRIIYTEKNHEYLINIFGEDIFLENGEINLSKIRDLFIEDSGAGKDRRELFYVYFGHDIWREIERIANDSCHFFVFIENAVLFEYSWQRHFNLIVCVYCTDEEARRRILTSRKSWNIKIYEAFKKIQLPVERKIELSDVSIDTTNIPPSHTIEALVKLLNKNGIAT